jgi:hypothetical protein
VGTDAAAGAPGRRQLRSAESAGRAGAVIGRRIHSQVTLFSLMPHVFCADFDALKCVYVLNTITDVRHIPCQRITFTDPFRCLGKGDHMSKLQTAEVATPAQLDELIEEATVDCYDEEEQASGFFAAIEDNLALPFTTRILGVEASVAAVEISDDGRIKAVCERSGEQQRIDLIDLPLPSPPPSGAEWIAAYRRWVEGGGFAEDEEEEEDE